MNLAFSSIHINVVLGRGWVTISMWHFFACVPLSTFSRGLVRHPCMLYMMTKGRQALWQALEGWELLAPNGGLRASLENFRRSFAGVLARSRLLSCMQIVHLAHRHWGSMRPCPVGHRASKKYQSSACLKIQKGSLSVQPMFWCQLSWYQYHYLDWIFRGGSHSGLHVGHQKYWMPWGTEARILRVQMRSAKFTACSKLIQAIAKDTESQWKSSLCGLCVFVCMGSIMHALQ